MKRVALAFVIAALLGGPATATQQSAPPPKGQAPSAPDRPGAQTLPPITGKWTMALTMSMGVSRPALTFKQDGETITGTYAGRYGTFPLEGTLKGRAIEFALTMEVESEKVEMSFVGEVAADGQSMHGDADLGQAGDGTWTATREKDKS